MSHPFTCDAGCHSGDFADFDHYFDAEGWQAGQEGDAFGCWLAGRFKIDVVGEQIRGTSGGKGMMEESDDAR